MKTKIPFFINFIISIIAFDIIAYHKIVNDEIMNHPYMVGMTIFLGIVFFYNLASGLFKYLNNQQPLNIIPFQLNFIILLFCEGILLYYTIVNDEIMNHPYMNGLFISLISISFYNIGSLIHKYLNNGNTNTRRF
jgi:UDP-N-acetylmuramyl pentapeptide phosphotransferase/UDP-N-acetylglucosamine-1-phosphate transferase